MERSPADPSAIATTLIDGLIAVFVPEVVQIPGIRPLEDVMGSDQPVCSMAKLRHQLDGLPHVRQAYDVAFRNVVRSRPGAFDEKHIDVCLRFRYSVLVARCEVEIFYIRIVRVLFGFWKKRLKEKTYLRHSIA